MFFVNKFIKLRFKSRYKKIEKFKNNPLAVQANVFLNLIEKSKNTIWGKRYNYSEILNKDFNSALIDFQSRVPISSYEKLYTDIEKVILGEENILWPGKTKWLAKSSGTTNSKSKLIPITTESLKKCHYQGGEDVIALYLKSNPRSKLFSGKTLSVGGSFIDKKNSNDSSCGDLSAILIHNLPLWAKIFRAPRLSTALLGDWELKIDMIAKEAIKRNITALAGVPSWTLVVLNRVLEITGKNNISQVWPNLELFIHGGVSFSPYKEQFKKIIPSPKMNYFETYNASEGFFALNEQVGDDDMLLILDSGVFYEFIPLAELDQKEPKVLDVSQVELNKTYALVISTNGGLWRYLIGDTVTITSLKPLKIKVAGRTKHFINVFGEELMVSNTDEALRLVSEKTGVMILDYTVAPVFMENSNQGGHEWLIEFSNPPENIDIFTRELDLALKSLNSDYEAKRFNDMILLPPKINIARSGLFYNWLKNKGKLGGQNKVPRLSNSREYLEELLKLI
ncbi:MAG: GH3 auxin-responsive promoter family protein [Patescibacteria group bacterium]|nr:GH3 auxin-responsive promoter family protein [Patescibacteria group bacterium]